MQHAPLISVHLSFISVSFDSSLDTSENKEMRTSAELKRVVIYARKEVLLRKYEKGKGGKLLSDSQTGLDAF